MKKKLQRVLAGFVAAGLCMSMISVTAFADDEPSFTDDEETVTNEVPMSVIVLSSEGTSSDPVTNEDGTVTTGESGNADIEVEGNKYNVLYDEKTTTDESSYTDEDGNTVDETASHTEWTFNGEETVEEQDEETDDPEESDGDSSGSNAVITGNGYEDSTEKIVTASNGNTILEEGSAEGEQHTTITDTLESSGSDPESGTETDLELTDTTVYSDPATTKETVTIDADAEDSGTETGYVKVDVEKYVEDAKAAAEIANSNPDNTQTLVDDEGNTYESKYTIDVEEYYENDELKGYTKTETTTITYDKDITTEFINAKEDEVSWEENGYKTTVSVTPEYAEDGETVVGYTAVTKIADSTGFVISERTETVTGSTTTTVSEVTTTTTTRYYDLQAAIDFTVTMSDVTAGADHGTEKLKPQNSDQYAKPDNNRLDSNNDLYGRPKKYQYRPDGKYYNPNEYVEPDGTQYEYVWNGIYGQDSAIRVLVQKGDGATDNEQAHLFELESIDGETTYYVYCCDLSSTIKDGYGYNMYNLEEADYYTEQDAAAHIRAIAEVGYWGTVSGKGSLEALKTYLLEKNGTTDDDEVGATGLTNNQITSLTRGEAITATQAAIWYYGNNSEGNLYLPESTSDSIIGYYQTDGGGNKPTDEDKAKIVQALYAYLVSLPGEEASAGESLLDQGSITGASITVKSVATDSDSGEILKEEDGSIVYNTDVSFVLAVQPSDTNTLEVVINNGNNELQRKSLSDITPVYNEDNGTYTYTIKDVKLADGTTIDIKLTGTQDISGVYLFKSVSNDGYDTNSQTLIGLASGTQDVNLSFSLTFTAELRENYTDTSETNTLQVIQIDEKWARKWINEYFEKPDDPGEPDEPDRPTDPGKPENPDKPDEPEIPEIPSVPTTPSTPAQPEAPATGTTEVATQPETTTTTEAAETAENQTTSETVISDVPMTGDESHMATYLVLAMLSGAALIGLGATGKKKNEEV